MERIYYCWFGGSPLTPEIKKYIETWRKHFPTYEIFEINEKNFDVNRYQYSQQAYEAKKYAFVSDCARVDYLEKTGGIYFDTDVELHRNFGDMIPKEELLVMGMEKIGIDITGVSTAIILSTAHHPFLKGMQEYYEKTLFDNNDEPQTINETMNRLLEKTTTFKFNDKEQKFAYKNEEIAIYPSKLLMRNNKNAYAVHHLDGSWTKKMPMHRKVRRFFGIILKRAVGRNRFKKLWKK